MITGFDISKISSLFFVASIFVYLYGGCGCMLDVVMGYLLKEALKTICGVNKWSYAVFWKIGCQNPKLLIWEECYYEPITQSDLPHISGIENRELAIEDWEDYWVSAEARTSRLGIQARGRVHSIVNKMKDNQVNVIGQGLVGRAAFTGNHQWILSENYTIEAHPPEVLKEACQQFSAGMQTLAVIPVLPHGVVQLGSSVAIMEDMGFANEVKTLVRQLGCIPGALLSDSYATTESCPKIGVPISFGNSVSADLSRISKVTASTTFIADRRSQLSSSSQPPRLVGQSSYSLHSTGSTFQNSYIAQDSVKSNDDNFSTNAMPMINSSLQFRSQLENGVARAHVIPSNPEVWLNQETSLYTSRAGYGQQPCNGSSTANNGHQKLIEQQTLLDANYSSHVPSSFNVSQQRTNGGLTSLSHKDFITAPSLKLSELHSGCENAGSSRTKVSTSNFFDHLGPSGKSYDRNLFVNEKETQFDMAEGKKRVENDIFQALGIPLSAPDEHMKLSHHIPNFLHDSDKHTHGNSGDDLFDVLGVDFKNKLFNGSWNSFFNKGPHTKKQRSGKNDCGSIELQDAAGSDLYSVNEGNSDSCIFSVNDSDHLLDAVVSRVHSAAKQSSEDNVSCRTTLTNTCSSSGPLACLSSGRENLSNQIQGEQFGLPKSLTKAGALGSCLFRSGSSKEDAGTYSQTSSIYGSQISSWVEQEHGMKHNGSVSSAHSKRPDEISKSNRKRLKPGENPRPRPKDRQMIQDRVKELREIVPNSAKCSIDALLERTIKHMLFLQSVTKHGDKLNQTGGESKIISREGGLLLKDNFHGGATWAYEVGFQSMVCPIIVEDLNQPRQMLVEMLCEERGLFLEIADIVRGLGLTILKGVMETWNDKIWARFAVEANRDVTRMEIFISLVRLLEQTIKSSAVSGNCIDKDNIAVDQSFHQAVSIPATGRPCGFQ